MSFRDMTRAWTLSILRLRERLGADRRIRESFEKGVEIPPEIAEEMLIEHAREMARGKVTTYPRMPSFAEVEAHRLFFPAAEAVGVGWWTLVGLDDLPEIYLLGVTMGTMGGRRVYAIDRATRREIPLPHGVTLAIPIKVLR